MNKALPHCFFDSIVHYDMNRNEKRVHYFGDDALAVEPIFVPRTKNANEGDGYLLSYVYRKSLNRSDLVILDAKHVDDSPVAIVQLPHRVPFGFHGCWVSK
jgi:carotenoid cleavage dioxygenase-like enzyme